MEQYDRDDGAARTWRERLKRWQKSGLGGRKFAEQEGVNSNTLYYWSRRLGVKGTASTGRSRAITPRLLPVIVRPTELPAKDPVRMIEVVLRGGEVVRVPPEFDDEALTRVVRVLGGGR